MDMLVREGIEMDRQYVCESELPKFSALRVTPHNWCLRRQVLLADTNCDPERAEPLPREPPERRPRHLQPGGPRQRHGQHAAQQSVAFAPQQNLELFNVMKSHQCRACCAVTGMAMKMAAAGYQTHMFGKWRAPRSRRSFAVALVLTGFCVRRDVGRS